MLEPGGIALGMDGGELFFQTLETSEITLNPGDAVVFYTDGVTEAMNSEGEEFSMNRFMDTLMQSKDSGAGRMLEAIRKRVSDFTGDLPQQDDLTLVLLKAAPKPERT
jgi:sigma-B regulation protein RsbU (phosphoserine phosphatase)